MRSTASGGGPKPAPLSRRNQRIVALARRTVTAQPHQIQRLSQAFQHMKLTPAEQRLASRAAQQHGRHLQSMQQGLRGSVQGVVEGAGFGGLAHPVRRAQHPGGRMEFPGVGGASAAEARLGTAVEDVAKAYKPRTLTLGEHTQQIPKSRSAITRAAIEKPADKISERLQAIERARTLPGVRVATTEHRVTKAAGRAQRVEGERAKAAVGEHLHALGKVKPGSAEDVAHFWYAQLPARLRNAEGLRLVASKQREHLAELTSGKFSESLTAREKSLRAQQAKLKFGTPAWSQVANQIEHVGLIRSDLPRRLQDTAASIAHLDEVAAKAPPVRHDVIKAVHALGQERKRILLQSKRLKPEKAAGRESLVSRWLGVEPSGEEAYIGHRAPRKGAPVPAAPSAGVGRVRSPRGVGTQNRLVLAESGRLRPSVHVAAEDWHHAQIFHQANVARNDLGRMGSRFEGHVPEGHVLINPKGRTIPAHWKTDELAQFDHNWEDVADVRKKAEEIAAGFIAKDPQAVERLKAEADAAGMKRSELRVLREDLVHRYYSQFRRMAPPRGKKLKALDAVTDAVATSIIFARLGYIPKNLAQNAIMMVPHQGALLPRNVARAAQVMADPQLRRLVRAEVGVSGASREMGSELSAVRKVPTKIAQFSGAVADDTARMSAFLHEAAAEHVISKAKPLLDEQDKKALVRLLLDKSQRPLLNDIRSRSVDAMADFSRLTPDQARAARRFLVIPSWLMAGSRYPFHFAANHPIRSALLAYIASGEPGAPNGLHFNRPLNEYFTKGAAPWLQGIAMGGKTLRTGSLDPVSTPWEIGHSLVQTARGKANPFDFSHPTAFDYAAPLPSTLVDFASGGGVKSLERLVPAEKFARQMISPKASTSYPEDATRMGRLKRELGVVPIEVAGSTSAVDRARMNITKFEQTLTTAVHKAVGPQVKMPPAVRLVLDREQARAEARAELHEKLGRKLTTLDRFKSDVTFLVKQGQIEPQVGRSYIQHAQKAKSWELRSALGELTGRYFDPNGELSALRHELRQKGIDLPALHRP